MKNIEINQTNTQDTQILSKIDDVDSLKKEKKTSENSIIKILNNTYLKFIIKKGLFYFLVFFTAISIAFLIPRLIPGNPLERMLDPPPGTSDLTAWNEKIAELTTYFGLDLPLITQYLNFLANFFRGNLGQSLAYYPLYVTDIVAVRLGYTMMLVVPTVIVTFILGNLIGAHVGYQKGWKNKIGYYLSILLQSAPFFWFSCVILDLTVIHPLLFGESLYSWGDAPPKLVIETFLNAGALQDLIEHWIPPFLVLVICFSGGWATGMRSLMIYERNSDYILYCEKLGFKKKKMRRYAMRNCLLPQMTGLNLRFNEILGATLITEAVFQWPGLGSLIVYAFESKDYNLIVGAFIITILIIVIGNYLIDILYGVVDPRIRIGGVNK